jgi:molybdate transport system regulatory protein
LHEIMLRVTVGENSFLGPGKVRLLELIDETGSISAAARALEMSYRRAWLLVDSLNATFREPVLTAAIGGKQGGGATLTAFGRQVVARYRHMEAMARAAIAADVRALRSHAKPAGRKRVAPPRSSRLEKPERAVSRGRAARR